MLGELRHYGSCFIRVKHLEKGFEFFGFDVTGSPGLPASGVGKYHAEMAPGVLCAARVASSTRVAGGRFG
jgi:hypothetical protein